MRRLLCGSGLYPVQRSRRRLPEPVIRGAPGRSIDARWVEVAAAVRDLGCNEVSGS
jgi:hypothetical protein